MYLIFVVVSIYNQQLRRNEEAKEVEKRKRIRYITGIICRIRSPSHNARNPYEISIHQLASFHQGVFFSNKKPYPYPELIEKKEDRPKYKEEIYKGEKTKTLKRSFPEARQNPVARNVLFSHSVFPNPKSQFLQVLKKNSHSHVP